MKPLLVLVAWLALAAVVSAADPATPAAADAAAILARAVAAGEILPADLARLIALGQAPPIVDVRSDGEWREGHVPGAVHIPFAQVGDRVAELPQRDGQPASQLVIVYCAHGPRAWLARTTLKRRGVAPVIPLSGHWSRWAKEGLPVER